MTIATILETALYVENLHRSIEFYDRVLGLKPASDPSARLCALDVAPDQVLLLFTKGGSVRPTITPGGLIPATDGDGPLHVAFGIAPSAFDAWRDRITSVGVPIESEVSWPEGGRSLYFRDPDRHVIELKTSNWQGRPVREEP